MINLDEFETAEKRYQAWVRNKVLLLGLTMQNNRPKDARSLIKYEFFLEEIEHHFIDCHSGRDVWRAFSYLKSYFQRHYPCEKIRHREHALKMLDLIYRNLGFGSKKMHREESNKKDSINSSSLMMAA